MAGARAPLLTAALHGHLPVTSLLLSRGADPGARGDLGGKGRTPLELASLHKQWEVLALIAAGGTITHHHAVGRDHRPGYDAQRPEVFARALAAVRRRG